MKGTKKCPANEIEFVAGCDPYDHSTTTDSRRSDAASYVFKKFDIFEPESSHMFVCEYINRPPKVDVFYEDI